MTAQFLSLNLSSASQFEAIPRQGTVTGVRSGKLYLFSIYGPRAIIFSVLPA